MNGNDQDWFENSESWKDLEVLIKRSAASFQPSVGRPDPAVQNYLFEHVHDKAWRADAVDYLIQSTGDLDDDLTPPRLLALIAICDIYPAEFSQPIVAFVWDKLLELLRISLSDESSVAENDRRARALKGSASGLVMLLWTIRSSAEAVSLLKQIAQDYAGTPIGGLAGSLLPLH